MVNDFIAQTEMRNAIVRTSSCVLHGAACVNGSSRHNQDGAQRWMVPPYWREHEVIAAPGNEVPELIT